MMVGTCYTLFRMRKNLIAGLGKAFAELKGGAAATESVSRTERYMSSKTVFALIGCTFLVMCVLYIYLSGLVGGGIAAALVMLIVGFFFATVSGYLVGVIGSSNNPISGIDAFHAGDRRAADGLDGSFRHRAAWSRCWAWRRWSAYRRRWPANCCRISRSGTSWAALRAAFRSRS